MGDGDTVGDKWRFPTCHVRKQCNFIQCWRGFTHMGRSGRHDIHNKQPNRIYKHSQWFYRMEETEYRNTDTSNIRATYRNRVDWLFMDCNIWCWVFASCEYKRYYCCNELEQHNKQYLHADLMHECGCICGYSDIITDNGNADDRWVGGGNRCNVAGGCWSRTGTPPGRRGRDDVGGGAFIEWRRRNHVVAGILAQLLDCSGWRGDTRCEWRWWRESNGVFL